MNIKQHLDKASEKGILGEIVMWDAEKIEVPRLLVRAALEKHGFSKNFAPAALDRNAFLRGLRKLDEKGLIRKIQEDEEFIAFQLTDERVDAMAVSKLRINEVLKYRMKTRVIFDKSKDIKNAVTCDDESVKGGIIKYVTSAAEVFNTKDIRLMILRILNAEADIVPLKKGGGVYFLPAQFKKVADRLQKALSVVDGLSFIRFNIPNTAQDQMSVQDSVAESLKDSFESVQESIKKIDDVKGPIAKQNFVANRKKELDKIKKRVKMYSNLLDGFAAAADAINNTLKSIAKRAFK